jgi:hypothetical protein
MSGIQITIVSNVITGSSYTSGSTDLVIPDTVISIGIDAFLNLTALRSAFIPTSVTSIGNTAFQGCSSLTSIIIPDSVKTIGTYAFTGCTSLTSITISNIVTTISGGMFQQCSSLTSITIPSSVTSIGSYAFYVASLRNITIPSSVVSIGTFAFLGCINLQNVILQRTSAQVLTTLGASCFLNAGISLQSISNMYLMGYTRTTLQNTGFTNSAVDTAINTRYGTQFNVNEARSLISNNLTEDMKHIVIPSQVLTIGNNAFNNNYWLLSVVIPNSITSIGQNAFAGCSFVSVTIPSTVISLGNSAFANCAYLTSVTLLRPKPSLSAGLTTIALNCFANSGFTTTNYRSVADMLNMGYASPTLTTAGIPAAVVTAASNNRGIFITVSNAGVLTGYTYTAGPKDLVIPPYVTSIANSALLNCPLTSVTIPSSVISIGASAFQGCSALTDIILLHTTSTGFTLGSNCFLGVGFTTTNYKSSVDMLNIGFTATELNAAGIVADVTNIATTNLSYLVLNVDKRIVTSYNTEINITNMTIYIPTSVTSIDTNAFLNSTILSSITIPSSVTSIGSSAFQGCSSLVSVILQRTIQVGINQGLTTLNTDCFLNTGFTTTNYLSVTNMFSLGYTNSNLTSAGIVSSVRDLAISDAFLIFNNSTTKTIVTGYNSSVNPSGISIQIPGTVTSIANYVLMSHPTLTGIIIPSSVTSIGEMAFQGSTKLTSVTLLRTSSQGLTSLGYNCFFSIGFTTTNYLSVTNMFSLGYTYSNLTSAGIATSVRDLAILDAFLIFNSSTTKTIVTGYNSLVNASGISIKIPSTVTSIANNAFLNGATLTSVTIPSSVTSIEESAFQGCTALTTVTIQRTIAQGLTTLGVNSFLNAGFTVTNYLSVTNMFSLGYTYSNLTSAGIVTSVRDKAILDAFLIFNNPTTKTIVNGYNSSVNASGVSIEIPSTVTSIANNAFLNGATLTSIIIPSSVTSIGSTAFQGCTTLTSVTLLRTSSQGLTTLGSNCFLNTGFTVTNYLSLTNMFSLGYTYSNLTSAGIDTSVADLVILDAFLIFNDSITKTIVTGYNSSIIISGISIQIPSTVTSIANNAFLNCSTLTSITIPSSVTSIGSSAFEGSTTLTSVTLLRTSSQGLTTLDSNCFLNTGFTVTNYLSVTNMFSLGYTYSNLTSAGIATSVTDLAILDAFLIFNSSTTKTIVTGYNSSVNATGISIQIPSTVTSIANNAFLNFTTLTSITIPSSVTSIGSTAFQGCTTLTSITIPSSVTSIGSSAFQDCSLLVSVTLQRTSTQGLTTLESNCFLNTGFTVTNYQSVLDMVIMGYTRDNLITAGIATNIVDLSLGILITVDANGVIISSSYTAGSTDLVIPSTVTSIGNNAFNNTSVKTILTSVTIPSSVTSIGENAFEGCSLLTSITIPSSVISIASSAFQGCSLLVSVTLQRTSTQGLTTLGSNCFLNTGFTVSNYGSVLTMYNQEYTRNNLITSGIPENIVDTAIADVYFIFSPDKKTVTSFNSINVTGITMIIPSSVTTISLDAFLNWTSLTSIIIPSSVTSIGSSAFQGCSSLNSINIPSSVTSIGSTAFQGCSSLTSCTIPISVTTIGISAFYGCSSLTSISIPSSVISIASTAFQGCSLLTSVTLQRTSSQGLTILSSNCFLNTGLTVTSILTMYNQGYTRYNLITSGIPTNIIDESIVTQDGEVTINVYYYTDYFG